MDIGVGDMKSVVLSRASGPASVQFVRFETRGSPLPQVTFIKSLHRCCALPAGPPPPIHLCSTPLPPPPRLIPSAGSESVLSFALYRYHIVLHPWGYLRYLEPFLEDACLQDQLPFPHVHFILPTLDLITSPRIEQYPTESLIFLVVATVGIVKANLT